MVYDTIVVGAGASGLVAAIAAAREGASVCLIERNDRVGRKILSTGNGRCNLANRRLELGHFHGSNVGFAGIVLHVVGLGRVLEFFSGLGLDIAEEEGRLYPLSMQAAAVLDVLRHEVDRLGIRTVTDTRVERIARSGGGYAIITGQQRLEARRVILATGGKAAPKLGTTGDGYALASSFGHRIIDPVPALVGLRLSSPHLRGLAGVRIKGAVSIPELGIKHHGEVLFAEYGISGIPVFDLSAGASSRFRSGASLHLVVSILQETPAVVLERMKQRFSALAHKSALDALIGMLPRQIGPALLKDAGFSSLHKAAGAVSQAELASLATLLCAWKFPVVGHNGWDQAQTTAGGVDPSQVSPEDMQSKLCQGLYFAGEIVDVHGDCGGYNLMWAWSSGMLAGARSAGRTDRQSFNVNH